MGVIKKSTPISQFGHCDSESEESLHIYQSDDDRSSTIESESNEQVQHYPIPKIGKRRPIPTSFWSTRKNNGRKKSHRLENANQLLTLIEGEELEEINIEDFLPFRSSVFSQIIKNEVWNNFILSSESYSLDLISCKNIKQSLKQSLPASIASLTPDQAYQSIKNGLRATLKKKHVPLGIIEMLETGLTDHFNAHPKEPYFAFSLSCYERLLLHAISQYYRLISNSIDDKDKERIVAVLNPHDLFPLPNGRLHEYLTVKINNKSRH